MTVTPSTEIPFRSKVGAQLVLGFALIAFNYLLSWVLAIVYGRIAAGKFDPLAKRAALEFSGRGSLR